MIHLTIIHLIFNVRLGMAILTWMCEASGVIRFQLFYILHRFTVHCSLLFFCNAHANKIAYFRIAE